MKYILSLIISGALVASGFGQTRNVLVGTNNTVVQPTNFWSADASNARSGLGLGTAATNPATAFQSSSTNLTNLSTNNGASLTNIAISGVVGLQSNLDTKIATNGNASGLTNITATNITGIVALVNGGTGATNASVARTNLGLGATWLTNTDSSFFRSAIGIQNQEWLTNTSTFYVPISFGGDALGNASATRTNLGLGATWLTNTNVTNFRTAIGLGATNIPVFAGVSFGGGDLSISNDAILWSGIIRYEPETQTFSGDVQVENGAISIVGTNAVLKTATTRTNLGLGATWLTNTNVTNFRSAIGLGTNAQPVFDGLTILADLFAGSLEVAAGSNGTTVASDGIQFTGISAATTRTNLGLGATWLTNTNATNFRNAIGLGATNNAFASLSVGINITNNSTVSNASSAFGKQITIDSTVENSLAVGFGHSMSNFGNQAGGSVLLGGIGTMTNWGAFLFNGVPQGGTAAVSRGNSTFAVNASNGIYLNGPLLFEGVSSLGSGLLSIGSGGAVSKVVTNVSTATPAFVGWSGFAYTAFDAGTARTNLGLPWTGLTNTNAATFQAALFGSNTNPVLVDTGGSVVSPTNFWQQAPISSTFQESIPTTNSTNFATGSRSLHLHSLAFSINNVTNVILLRTNGTAFAGDNATIVHKGPTNSMTIVRSDGSTNNLITLTRFNEAVKFVYYGSVWNLDHNLSYVEPIYFAGTNTESDKAVSRTNLGLGLPALTNTNNANFQAAVFATNSNPTNAGNFNNHVAWMDVTIQTNGSNVSFRVPLYK
jgi:hypothetical protein